MRPLGQLVLGAALISFSPVFVKAAALEGLGPTSIAFWRLALGAAPLVVIVRLRGESLRIGGRALLLAAVAGVIFTADLYLWHRAIPMVGTGLATILGNTQVFNSALLAWLLFRERPAAVFYPAAVLGLGGVALLVGAGGGIQAPGDYGLGLVFGLATGLAYACYLMTTRTLARLPRGPALPVVVAWITIMGATGSGLVCLTESDRFLPAHPVTWLHLLGLGVLVQAAGWWVITAGLRHVKGSTAGLVLLLQPVLATVWGMLLFGEVFTWRQIAGAVLTLGAIALGTVAAAQAQSRE